MKKSGDGSDGGGCCREVLRMNMGPKTKSKRWINQGEREKKLMMVATGEAGKKEGTP